MRDERLSGINPYFLRDYENNQNGCVYGYFYTMNIEERLILETLYAMYRSMDITAYMETGYAYCKKHEQEIHRHIKENEGV